MDHARDKCKQRLERLQPPRDRTVIYNLWLHGTTILSAHSLIHSPVQSVRAPRYVPSALTNSLGGLLADVESGATYKPPISDLQTIHAPKLQGHARDDSCYS